MIRAQIEKFYQSDRWKRKREQVLRRDGYQCQEAKRYGKRVQAEVVHHALPLEDFPEYRLCMWNLVSLSRSAHNEMHDRDTNTLTEKGKWLARKVALQNGIEI